MRKFLLTAVFALIGSIIFAQQQPVVAVAPFDAISGISASDANVITRVFYNRLFNANIVTLVDRSVVERVIREHQFQLGDWSNTQKTAELGEALNADWIVRGEIERLGSYIIVTVQFFDIKTFQFRGGEDIRIANADEAYDRMDELVDKLIETIAGSGRPPGGTGDPTPIPANFVRIQGGTFLMGSPSSEPQRDGDEGPQHQVTVNSFYMSRYEVTQREYQEVMGTNPSYFRGDNLPVEQISWYDAIEYCNRRSERERLTPAYTIDKGRSDPNNRSENDTVRWLITWNRNANGYRLPTEAEWEYACRAGTVTPFNMGNNITTSLANYDGNYPYNNSSTGTYRRTTTTVGSFAPNPWGLYDMHGNVAEWCWDWFERYAAETQTYPQGAVSGYYRVRRGGSHYSSGQQLRSAYRLFTTPSDRSYGVGLRLVRNAQ